MNGHFHRPVAPCLLFSLLLSGASSAFVVSFSFDEREVTNVFSTSDNYNHIRNFSFSIDVAAPLRAGRVYSDPSLNGVVYNVFGVLNDPTPSNFPAFDLQRTITGSEFYAQGSSFSFEILLGAQLADGLQAGELASFLFNGRELDTGRFHPSLVELNNDGTGRLRNSDNFSVSPPAPRNVDVAYGEEYDIDLTFDPASLTLAIPEPFGAGGLALLGAGFLLRMRPRR